MLLYMCMKEGGLTMTTGERIKARREELGLSVNDVALMLGKHRATVYRYESDDIENFPADVLTPLAKVLNTTPAYLMGWADEPADDGDGVEVSTDVMRISKHQKKPTVKDDGLSEVERLFLSLPPQRREEVLRFMEYLASQSEK